MDDKRLILGYTSREHLLIDFDNCSLIQVFKLTMMLISEYPEIGDCLIVKSSVSSKPYVLEHDDRGIPKIKWLKDNYHLIGDNNIGYNKCCKIIEVLANLGIINEEYVRIRKFRNDMTLRISSVIQTTNIKQSPNPIIHIHNNKSSRHDGLINEYLNLLDIGGKIFNTSKFQS